MSITISGIGISRGIAIGKVYRLERGEIEIHETSIAKDLIEDEVARFRLPVPEGEPLGVTLCVGIATNGPMREGTTADLLHDAHRALRRAQDLGAGKIALLSDGNWRVAEK